MSPPQVALLVVAVLALFAALFWWAKVLERRRAEAFAAFAVRRGLAFSPEPREPAQAGLPPLPVLTRGRRNRVRNVLRRRDGEGEFALFDASYETGSHKNRHTHRHTVALFRLDRTAMPAFELSPENVLVRIASAFGYQDIDFDSWPAFSKSYLLRGRKEMAVRAFFGPPLLQYFERNPGWSVEADGTWLAVYRRSAAGRGGLVAPEALEEFVGQARQVAGQFRRD